MKELIGYVCCVAGLFLAVASLYFGWGWMPFVAGLVLLVVGVVIVRDARRGNDQDSLIDDAIEIGVDLLD